MRELKECVCDANLALERHGLVVLTWGNVGMLTDDGDAFVIKPSGVSYDKMTPDDMVLVSLEGKVVEGRNRPSSDTPTYVELFQYFRSRPDSAGLRGIVHTHSPAATAWAQARREIPCLGTTHADHFFGPVPLARPLTKDEVESAYEQNTGRVIVERFESGNLNPVETPGVLASGHGPFVWGKDAHDAVKNAVALESIAQMARDSCAIWSFSLLVANDSSDCADIFAIPSDTTPRQFFLEDYVMKKHYQRKHGPKAYYGQKSPDEAK
ncbi:MAG: L-ribulose-5-phosphate 4-epimerase AraD [Planctomycetia bacterium]|nr:L-ribulose-5-phosphate 4-epimerase AraD [Planctomycetia bacterium]